MLGKETGTLEVALASIECPVREFSVMAVPWLL